MTDFYKKTLSYTLSITIALSSIVATTGSVYASGEYSHFNELKNSDQPYIQNAQYQNTPDPQQCSPYLQKTAGPCETAPEVVAGGKLSFEAAKKAVIAFINGGFFSLISGFITSMIMNSISFFQNIFNMEVVGEIEGEANMHKTEKAGDAVVELMEHARMDVQRSDARHRSVENAVGEYKNREKALITSGEANAMCEIQTVSTYQANAAANAVISGSNSAKTAAANAAYGEGPLQELYRRHAEEGCVFTDPQGMNGSLEKVVEACEEMRQKALQKINAQKEAGEDDFVPSACDYGDTENFHELSTIKTIVQQPDKSGCEAPNTSAEIREKMRVFKNYYNSPTTTPVPQYALEEAYDEETGKLEPNVLEYLLAKKTLDSLNSVARNTLTKYFETKEGAYSPVEGAQDQETLMSVIGTLIKGADVDEDEFVEFTGRGDIKPSYDAQLEFMSRIQYLNPVFYSVGFGKEEEDSNQKYMNLQTRSGATESIVLYESLKSSQRSEALLATMIEVMLTDRQAELEALSATLSGE